MFSHQQNDQDTKQKMQNLMQNEVVGSDFFVLQNINYLANVHSSSLSSETKSTLYMLLRKKLYPRHISRSKHTISELVHRSHENRKSSKQSSHACIFQEMANEYPGLVFLWCYTSVNKGRRRPTEDSFQVLAS